MADGSERDGISCQGCALLGAAAVAGVWAAARAGWLPAWAGTAALVVGAALAGLALVAVLVTLVGLARHDQ
jgi:hypothetical protein